MKVVYCLNESTVLPIIYLIRRIKRGEKRCVLFRANRDMHSEILCCHLSDEHRATGKAVMFGNPINDNSG